MLVLGSKAYRQLFPGQPAIGATVLVKSVPYSVIGVLEEKKQNSNIQTGLRLARATADYPPGSQFKWNVEVLWPVDNYLSECSPDQRESFIRAVRAGQIGLDAFYDNALTGLSRPEELLNLMGYAMRLSQACGVRIESAMISDVPGYTWSTVSAMTQAGVNYFSFAPNYFDRMGSTMKQWQNRPFWWEGPDGHSRVLCWCPSRGYALGHLIGEGAALTRFLPDYLSELETNAYPYDITYLRWNVHGDNGSPDEPLKLTPGRIATPASLFSNQGSSESRGAREWCRRRIMSLTPVEGTPIIAAVAGVTTEKTQ